MLGGAAAIVGLVLLASATRTFAVVLYISRGAETGGAAEHRRALLADLQGE